MWYCGREQTVLIGGDPFKLTRFPRRLFRAWLEWADRQIPDELAGVDAILNALPADLAWQAARKLTLGLYPRKSLSHPAINDLFCSSPGVRYALALCLEQPASIEERELIIALAADEYGDEVLTEWLQTAQGRLIPPAVIAQLAYMREVGALPPVSSVGGAIECKPTDWLASDKNLCEARNWTPQQIDEMTLPEIIALTSKDEVEGLPQGIFAEGVKKLTASQIIEMNRRIRG